MTIHAQAALKAKGPLVSWSFEEGPLGPFELEIDVTHCGICHSDVHLVDNNWGVSSYPLVPGHEVIGKVRQMGTLVTGFEKGMRVGIGWQSGACLRCEWCISGEDNICPDSQATCIGRHGGFAERIRSDSRFAFPIPSRLKSENAAPLLCGGATVYSPLRRYRKTPNLKVGVIGIGGLGHLALQFAAEMGFEVTAFSTTANKEPEARAFGARHFVVTSEPGAIGKAAGRFDIILNTVHANLDWQGYLEALRPNGRLVILGAPQEDLRIAGGALIGSQKGISGSAIGSRSVISEMLEFAARHGIKAKTETMPMSRASEALDRVRSGKARYRMVLVKS
ncbi:MAG: NAD(P)-dependent alcohol dehydrogenase [Deltaproteobacteria bacterium]|nr:NAD(P)-dependent alcohol dehydrogenase [Deltaproteobacteria bacterium]